MIEPWKTKRSRLVGDYRVFRLRADQVQAPRTGTEHEFFVLDCPGWVNVLALTPDSRAVLVEQYRHGTGTVELEVPGGVMDPSEVSPVEAAIRELREETGYEGVGARVIGQVFANPAILSNTVYTVLVEECRPKHALQWDASEELATRLVPVSELPDLVARGDIRHSLVVAALFHLELFRRGLQGIRPEAAGSGG
jgi:8-oxo-dGTP pyrophosphatase MutT (NUDIX family)